MNIEEATKVINELVDVQKVFKKYWTERYVNGIADTHIHMSKEFMAFADAPPVERKTCSVDHRHWDYTINGVKIVSLTNREESK